MHVISCGPLWKILLEIDLVLLVILFRVVEKAPSWIIEKDFSRLIEKVPSRLIEKRP